MSCNVVGCVIGNVVGCVIGNVVGCVTGNFVCHVMLWVVLLVILCVM